jgi:ferredoxin
MILYIELLAMGRHMNRIVFACSCEDSMTLDKSALRACGGELRTSDFLCRTRLDAFRAALAEGRPITVGCTQESPLFQEVADEAAFTAALDFTNIRENAGWSSASGTGPKMAALLAAAAIQMPATSLISLQSEGVALIYGRDEAAIEVGKRLADTLDVTVLLTQPGDVTPPASGAFPVLRGTIGAARGHLGAFELTVNDYARPSPASRAALRWGPSRNGAVSRCDIVLDLTGSTLFGPRPGYLRADPARPETVERLIGEAQTLIGAFDKPHYIEYNQGLCAHTRSKRTGCTRCLDLCPTGAITPAGDHVALDAAICAGCGACAAICPTGAASYALPPAAAVLTRVRAMLMAYRDAGGRDPVLLLHDETQGQALIDACARFGAGLPANVLPLRLNEVTQAGLALIVGSFAYGVDSIIFLLRSRPEHDPEGLRRTLALADAIRPGRCTLLETDDPDTLSALTAQGRAIAGPSRFLPMGDGRELTVAALKELHRVAPLAMVPLPEGAPFGTLAINAEGCTLCHACVIACPTGALRADPDKPMLSFAESACVQCGLCRATCPEKVIALVPRLAPEAWTLPPIVVKHEEPYPCIACGKPFGTRSSIERIAAKLAEKHWMFAGDNARRIDVIRMCDTCRVEAVVNEGFDPHAAPPRPPVRLD